ncbi:hypothetical protein E1293_41185 [Actinomadura darangshiensis]|uniref:Uncharacterized protein n=1 Tax=Actinomadura darangshiensis TaxID=705336 RepID=A0A4R5A1A1_9ACTN|nr:hypothetical protein [Actinomadura darangshiensis]TDD64690.1 hypothetical protein E1293_41185 [Actinomadura darangshiensis]
MKAPIRLAAPLAAASAVLALTVPAASAATTTLREETATGAPYSGNWQVSTVGPLEFSVDFLGSKVTGSCDDAKLQGSVVSTGAGELTAASVGACRTSNGLSSPATDLDLGDLPEDSGDVAYDPVAGGRDGTLSINGDLRFKMEGQVLGITITCYYGFRTGDTDGLVFDVYNRDNPNRPLPGQDDAQGSSDNITLVRESGSSGLCPSNGTGSGAAIARGESTPGAGVFDRKLYLTS